MDVMNRGKSEYWQAIRGVCILAVIMIHCPTGQQFSTADTYAWLILRQVINFPVALFIFMAGYFVNADRVKRNMQTYLLNRGGGRLLIPYFVWSMLYLMKDSLTNSEITVKHIIYAFCTGKAATPFYYIVVMVQLTLLTPWLIKIKNRKWLYVVTSVYLVFLYGFNLYTGQMPRFYETFFPAWFIFYIFGMDCRAGKWDNSIKKVQKSWIIMALLISIIEGFVLLETGCAIGFASSQIRFGSFLYSSVIALVLMKYRDMGSKNSSLKKLTVSIGNCSYGIFYVHMLVLMIVRKALSMTWMSQTWILDFVACFALTAVGSYLIVIGTKSLAKKLSIEKVLNLIGF